MILLTMVELHGGGDGHPNPSIEIQKFLREVGIQVETEMEEKGLSQKTSRFFFLLFFLSTVPPTKQLNATRRDYFSKTQLVASHVCKLRAGTRAKTANARACASEFDS